MAWLKGFSIRISTRRHSIAHLDSLEALFGFVRWKKDAIRPLLLWAAGLGAAGLGAAGLGAAGLGAAELGAAETAAATNNQTTTVSAFGAAGTA